MAINRPARGGGQEKDNGTSKIEKGSWEDFQKALTGPGQKLLPAHIPLTPPNHLKSETDWIQWLRGVSIAQVSEYLEGKSPDSLDVTQSLALRTLATKILKATDKLPDGFNEWLEFFSSMTRSQTELFIHTHSETMDNEAMAAGMRWLQIAENPALIDKIVNSRLENRKTEELGDIMTAAKSGDDLVLYEAIRNNIAWKIQEGSGARDMSVLIKQLNEVTTHLNAIYRERGMKDDQQNNIRKLLVSARQRARRPKQQATVTISDYEEDDVESL